MLILGADRTGNLKIGDKSRGKLVRDVVQLPDGQYLIKTEGQKSPKDFKVKLVTRRLPAPRSITPKHSRAEHLEKGEKVVST